MLTFVWKERTTSSRGSFRHQLTVVHVADRAATAKLHADPHGVVLDERPVVCHDVLVVALLEHRNLVLHVGKLLAWQNK